ncbi:MAG TPA: alpha-1,4-glucan--maltose-1-phosphate maltosyltransferase [Candidatus Dormibacteraeota bacterium]|nr:alpha-1,4-glucan--maltose-1-phosphate maltosyltransferase [Candidatus Dormibacteraeota bacterium]
MSADKTGRQMGLPIRRAVIESVRPEIDSGRFPIKRIVGDKIEVTADIFCEGHDLLGARLLYRTRSQSDWNYSPMSEIVNDRWVGAFRIGTQETHVYTIEAWPDAFKSWVRDLKKRKDADQDLSLEFLVGAELIAETASRAGSGSDCDTLRDTARQLAAFHKNDPDKAFEIAAGEELAIVMGRYPDLEASTRYERELSIEVDRDLARFSSWYEMFPRSCSDDASQHGTFRSCIQRLDYVADMGFDILYLPPIHPIGEVERKGKNNSTQRSADAAGSPWAIGSKLGGHKAIHPQLGTLDDFKELLAEAKKRGIEVALDLAFQCAPDHPYVREHPEWFRIRPDGSVQYAENPPKKYQDIYPINFESEHAQELCEELKSVALYWIGQGVRIFRVDNPHTKPFAFWEWLIGEVRGQHPEVIFLAEAFTRPKVMYRLAKLGFTQSYTYFAWRNNKWELTEYFEELTQTELKEFFRPNLWPNTPDILTEYLQYGGRPAFVIRLCLAAALGANYGIYGPAFELFENRAFRPGSEEYLDSEKYQTRAWDIGRPDSLKDLTAKINAIRKHNIALQRDDSLRFHSVDNEQIIAFSKMSEDRSNVIVVVVNLDPHHKQSGWIDLPLDYFHLELHQEYQMHDLVTEDRFLWQGPRNYVEIDPQRMPAHIFRLRRRVRSEHDFDYFL